MSAINDFIETAIGQLATNARLSRMLDEKNIDDATRFIIERSKDFVDMWNGQHTDGNAVSEEAIDAAEDLIRNQVVALTTVTDLVLDAPVSPTDDLDLDDILEGISAPDAPRAPEMATNAIEQPVEQLDLSGTMEGKPCQLVSQFVASNDVQTLLRTIATMRQDVREVPTHLNDEDKKKIADKEIQTIKLHSFTITTDGFSVKYVFTFKDEKHLTSKVCKYTTRSTGNAEENALVRAWTSYVAARNTTFPVAYGHSKNGPDEFVASIWHDNQVIDSDSILDMKKLDIVEKDVILDGQMVLTDKPYHYKFDPAEFNEAIYNRKEYRNIFNTFRIGGPEGPFNTTRVKTMIWECYKNRRYVVFHTRIMAQIDALWASATQLAARLPGTPWQTLLASPRAKLVLANGWYGSSAFENGFKALIVDPKAWANINAVLYPINFIFTPFSVRVPGAMSQNDMKRKCLFESDVESYDQCNWAWRALTVDTPSVATMRDVGAQLASLVPKKK